MRHVMMITAAFALLAIAPATATAQKIDKNGRCHDAAGRFAKMEVCKGARSASTPSVAPSAYKLDAKGNCHDAKGKMVKKALCKAA